MPEPDETASRIVATTTASAAPVTKRGETMPESIRAETLDLTGSPLPSVANAYVVRSRRSRNGDAKNPRHRSRAVRFETVDEHVLLVEDDASIREIATLGLERAGFRITASGDGRDALIRFRQTPFDLVVLDVMLPSLDGFEV